MLKSTSQERISIVLEFLLLKGLNKKNQKQEEQQILSEKPKQTIQQINDPFNNPHEELVVKYNLTEDHSLLFNKFAVVDQHLLIVTKKFQSQTDVLNLNDFKAAVQVMHAIDGFMFYNSGQHSGYSQQHKHLQLMPRANVEKNKLFADIEESVQTKIRNRESLNQNILLDQFQFMHSLRILNNEQNFQITTENADKFCKDAEFNYLSCMKYLKNEKNTYSYNLLMTKDWMLIVLRSKADSFNGIFNPNSIIFTGSVLVKNEVDFNQIKEKQIQPSKILAEVTFKNEEELQKSQQS